MPRATILVVEPDLELRTVMEENLSAAGYKVTLRPAIFDDADSELPDVELIIADADQADWPPEQILNTVGRRAAVIFLSRGRRPAESIPGIVELMKSGAADYLVKPVDGVTLLRSVHRALRVSALERKVQKLEAQNARLAGFAGGIVGNSAALQEVRRVIETFAPARTPILILGETGVGKELVARQLHARSGRRGEFVAVNAASCSETLFESELFGYEPGAFTGAQGRKLGLVEVADEGTLFLDEIGDLPRPVQARLLRFLDDGRFRRVGGIREVETDVRIVAATNRALDCAAAGAGAEGSFRSDLFYRIAACTISIPPLRDRRDDLPPLVAHFRARFIELASQPVADFPREIVSLLQGYLWPGNVRELKNFVDKICLVAPRGGTEALAFVRRSLPVTAAAAPAPPDRAAASAAGVDASYRDNRARCLDEFDRRFLAGVLAQHDHNTSAAARALGIDRKTLYLRLKELGMRK